MPPMTEDQALAFIAAKPRTAKLATTKKDGSPHVVPVWVDLDGRSILFTVGKGSLKAKAMGRDPRVSMCFDDETPPFSFVTVSGTVAMSDDLDEMLRWATRIGGRYMGADRADEYGRRNAVPEELLVRLTPTRIVGFADIAD
jgi:PPOX class probable F420-dependent enzyme